MLPESTSLSCSVIDKESPSLLQENLYLKHSAESFTKGRQSNPHETDKKEMWLPLFFFTDEETEVERN